MYFSLSRNGRLFLVCLRCGLKTEVMSTKRERCEIWIVLDLPLKNVQQSPRRYGESLPSGCFCLFVPKFWVLCHFVNAGWVARTLRGGGNTQNLPAVIEFILNFLHSQAVGKLKHQSYTPRTSHKSHLVKLSQHLISATGGSHTSQTIDPLMIALKSF